MNELLRELTVGELRAVLAVLPDSSSICIRVFPNGDVEEVIAFYPQSAGTIADDDGSLILVIDCDDYETEGDA